MTLFNSNFFRWHIKSNQKKLIKMIDQVDKENSLPQKCVLAQKAASFAVNHTTDVFSSKIIEKPFMDLAKSIKVPIDESYKKDTVLHVLTEAYNTGGHTRCVERWISLLSDKCHSCAVLRQTVPFPESLRTITEKNGGDIYFFDKNKKVVLNAISLRQLASKFEYVVLHIHMDDPTALIAFGTEKFKRPILFFNHADHAFWLGASISDCVADLNSYRNSITNKYRRVFYSKILGIPLDKSIEHNVEKNLARGKIGIPIEKKVIYSGGQVNKYLPIGYPSFENIINDIIEMEPNVLFIIAGVEKNKGFWKKLLIKFPNNLILPGRLDYATEYPYYLGASDLVIDSWPVSGETAIIDAVNLGKPVLTLSVVMQADYLVNSLAACKSYNELIEKSIHILNDNNFARTIYEDVYNKQNKEIDPVIWKEKCCEILKDMPKQHKVYDIGELKLPLSITRCSFETCRWTEPCFLSFSLKKLIKWFFFLDIRKKIFIFRFMGIYFIKINRRKNELRAESYIL